MAESGNDRPAGRDTPEQRAILDEMIRDGAAFCESNTLDGHKATRIGTDLYLYCDIHDEKNH